MDEPSHDVDLRYRALKENPFVVKFCALHWAPKSFDPKVSILI